MKCFNKKKEKRSYTKITPSILGRGGLNFISFPRSKQKKMPWLFRTIFITQIPHLFAKPKLSKYIVQPPSAYGNPTSNHHTVMKSSMGFFQVGKFWIKPTNANWHLNTFNPNSFLQNIENSRICEYEYFMGILVILTMDRPKTFFNLLKFSLSKISQQNHFWIFCVHKCRHN